MSPGAVPSQDALLVDALRRGDEDAFTDLVQRYGGALLRLARLHVTDAGVAEEVVQETWLGLLHGLDRFQGRSSLKTWLFRILVNIAKTRAVREGRTVPFSALHDLSPDAEEPTVTSERFLPLDHPRWPGHWSSPPQEWGATPEEMLLSDEIRRTIERAIATLSLTQRHVITLHDIEGLTSAEICNVLELSETNQRVLLHRARSRVRAHLERYFARSEIP